MACKACFEARARRKARLESRRKHDAERHQRRQEQIAKAKQNGVRIIYTDAGGQ